MITIPPDTFIQVQDDTGRKGQGRWHACAIGRGILCDVIRAAVKAEQVGHPSPDRVRTVRWRFGTDKVSCPSCLTIMQAQTVVRHSVYELVNA